METEKRTVEARQRIWDAVEEIVRDPSFFQDGVLYNRVLNEEVSRRVAGADGIEDVHLGVFRFINPLDVRQVEEDLQTKPRGHWISLEQTLSDGRVFYAYRMSDGLGGLCGRYDHYDEPPTFEKARERLLSSEIYDFRQKIERGIATEKRKDCLGRMNLQQGQKVKDVEIIAGSERHKFATVTVTGIDYENGFVSAEATKRGTRKRFNLSGIVPQALEPFLSQQEEAELDFDQQLSAPGM